MNNLLIFLSESYYYQFLRNGNHSSHVDCGKKEDNDENSLIFGDITPEPLSSTVITSRSLTTIPLTFPLPEDMDDDANTTTPSVGHMTTVTMPTTQSSTTDDDETTSMAIAQLTNAILDRVQKYYYHK